MQVVPTKPPDYEELLGVRREFYGGEPLELTAFKAWCKAMSLQGRFAQGGMELLPFFELALFDYFAGVRETVVIIPKKNAKSSTMGALALFHLAVVPEAAVFVGAASKDQTKPLFRSCSGYLRRKNDLGLAQMFRALEGTREIRCLETDGLLRVVPADADTVDGIEPTLALVDELHRHKKEDLYGVMRDGLGTLQGQIVTISTAGDDPDSALGQIRERVYKSGQVQQDGVYRYYCDGTLAFHEWALDPDWNREDLALVAMANPAWWQDEEELAIRRKSPSMRDWQWGRFACGVWLAGEDAAVEPHEWTRLAQNTDTQPYGVDIARCPVRVLSIDYALRRDSTAIVTAGFIPEDDLQGDEPSIHVAPAKILVPKKGQPLTPEQVIAAIKAEIKLHDPTIVVIDPQRGGETIAMVLEADLGIEIVAVAQEHKVQAEFTGALLQAIGERDIVHSDDPGLNAHVFASALKPVGEEADRLVKNKRLQKLIDAAVALAMAVMVGKAPPEASYYDDPNSEFVVLPD